MMTRRVFAKCVLGVPVLVGAARRCLAVPGLPVVKLDLGIDRRFRSPVRIEAVELVRWEGRYYVRVRSAEGGVGVVAANRQPQLSSLFGRLVAPFFRGRDARQIERLVDEVYVHGNHYKYAGMPFWNCVAQVELAVLDLLGRKAQVAVGELLGRPLRSAIPVYVSRFNRTNSAEEEVGGIAEALKRTGARACKLKIGSRMGNSPAQTRRDTRMIELARETLGPQIVIYVDANGSYGSKEAIQMGRRLEANGVSFLEEPCPWQDYEATRRVTDALQMDVAGGEQDSSQAQWRWMIRERCVDVVQPDLYYNGGMIRALRIARLAQQAGLSITPHSPKTGVEAAANLQFASVVPNLGPYQEYREAPDIVAGEVRVPTEPGFGLNLDPGAWEAAEVVV